MVLVYQFHYCVLCVWGFTTFVHKRIISNSEIFTDLLNKKTSYMIGDFVFRENWRWTKKNSWNCSRSIYFTWWRFHFRFDYATVHNQVRSPFDQIFLNGFGFDHLPFRNIQSGHCWWTCKFWPENRKFINCKDISWQKPKSIFKRCLFLTEEILYSITGVSDRGSFAMPLCYWCS